MTLDVNEANTECNKFRNSILTCNVQSYNKNSESLKELVYKLNYPKIINLIEIWQPKLQMKIDNYHEPLKYIRTNKRGGGICIFTHESLRFKEYEKINLIKSEQIEKIAVEIIEKNCKNYLVIACYRPPDANLKKSKEELEIILKSAKLSELPIDNSDIR